MVTIRMAGDENRSRAEARSTPQGHGGVYPESSGGIGSGRNHAALIRAAADNDGLAFQARIEKLFDRHEKGIHIDVKNSSFRQGHLTVGTGNPAGPPTHRGDAERYAGRLKTKCTHRVSQRPTHVLVLESQLSLGVHLADQRQSFFPLILADPA